MPKIQKPKARKEYKCSKCGNTINKGEVYLKGITNFRKPTIRCQKCGLRMWELSSSNYIQTTGWLLDNWRDYDEVDEIIDVLSELQSEVEESLENIPEQLREYSSSGELLQERYDNLDDCIRELEDIDTSDENWTSEVDSILESYL